MEGGLWSDYYDKLGLVFFWRQRVMVWGAGDIFGPEVMAVIRVLSPAWVRPLVTLLEVDYMPEAQLIGVRWSAWGMTWEWRLAEE